MLKIGEKYAKYIIFKKKKTLESLRIIKINNLYIIKRKFLDEH